MRIPARIKSLLSVSINLNVARSILIVAGVGGVVRLTLSTYDMISTALSGMAASALTMATRDGAHNNITCCAGAPQLNPSPHHRNSHIIMPSIPFASCCGIKYGALAAWRRDMKNIEKWRARIGRNRTLARRRQPPAAYKRRIKLSI